MKILTVPKNLDIGGSQVNAVDIATEQARRGHDVVIASKTGPLSARMTGESVQVVDVPGVADRSRRIGHLTRLVRDLQPDVIHAYEVRNVLDLALACARSQATGLLGTIYSTRVPWYLPESVPITVGMPSLYEFTKRWRTGDLHLIAAPAPVRHEEEPTPMIDLTMLEGDGPLIVVISRLVEPFKKEGIERSIAAVRTLESLGYRMLVVGDGSARPTFESAARKVNEEAGRPAILFTGASEDPSWAFDAADVVVGNGTSIVRAVIEGVPSVVVGREGFSQLVDLTTVENLVHHGFYGVGDGLSKPDALPEQIEQAIESDRSHLVPMGGDFRSRFDVTSVAIEFERVFQTVVERQAPGWPEMARAIGRNLHYRAHRRALQRRARSKGLKGEIADNFVFGTLRNMALPSSHRMTGRNKPV